MIDCWERHLEDIVYTKDAERKAVKTLEGTDKERDVVAQHIDLSNGRIFKQCVENLKPLMKALRKENLNNEILDALFVLVKYCTLKEYVRANDIYMALCIGNSPWPIGVTMVGIHERSARTKIFASQVTHILNDETQRKYL